MMDHIAFSTASDAASLPPHSVCLLLRAAVRFQYRPRAPVMRQLLRLAARQLAYFGPRDLCQLLRALAQLKFRPSWALATSLLRRTKGKLAAFKVA